MTLARFANLFKLPKVPDASLDREKNAARGIVKSLANGNVSLQLGRYVTAEDLDIKKKKLANHKFA